MADKAKHKIRHQLMKLNDEDRNDLWEEDADA